jgi:hypothetical protein
MGICGAVKIVEMEWPNGKCVRFVWLVVDRGIFGWVQCSCLIDDGYGVTSPNGNKFGIAPQIFLVLMHGFFGSMRGSASAACSVFTCLPF